MALLGRLWFYPCGIYRGCQGWNNRRFPAIDTSPSGELCKETVQCIKKMNHTDTSLIHVFFVFDFISIIEQEGR